MILEYVTFFFAIVCAALAIRVALERDLNQLPDDWTPDAQGRNDLVNLNKQLDELRKRAREWDA